MFRSLALVGVAVVAFAACSHTAEVSSDPLGQSLLRAVDGYTAVSGPVSGPMSTETAQTSTTADASKLGDLLRRTGFQGGYSRAWTKGKDFVTALVFDFGTTDRATGLVQFELDDLHARKDAVFFSVPKVPGASGFGLSAVTTRKLASAFCQGVWFVRGTRAYNVNTCSTQPSSYGSVMSLAERQYARSA